MRLRSTWKCSMAVAAAVVGKKMLLLTFSFLNVDLLSPVSFSSSRECITIETYHMGILGKVNECCSGRYVLDFKHKGEIGKGFFNSKCSPITSLRCNRAICNSCCADRTLCKRKQKFIFRYIVFSPLTNI